MKNKDNDINCKHIESDTTSEKRRISFVVECYRTHLKAFQKTKGSLKPYEIQMIQNNASWKDRIRNVLNGKWKGFFENLQHSDLHSLVVLG